MKVSLKFILATILLMLSYSIGGNAMDFASCVSKCESSCQLSESSSDIKSNSSLNSRAVGFDKSSQSLTISDVELGFKSVSETSSNNYRLRRIIEVNDSLKDVMHKFSLLRENSLVLDQSKSYYSDKDPHYSIISSDYMETTKKSQIVGIKNAGIVIICCFIIAVCIYHFLLGNPSNFMNNDPNNHPLPGNFLGTIYKGGIIVPVIQTLLLTVLALSIERYFALRSAFGKGSLAKFVANIKAALAAGDIKKAQEICDKQRGSVANVVTSTLRKYEEMEKNTSLPKEQKLLAIQKELEEATALEMPMMQQNLPIIATITTLGTLMGLLGTVIGMIRSFAALSAGGGADSMALSQGISEALINTAFGILTGALAVISYNYFTNKIDKLTYGLDEVGFSIVQTFAATH